MAKMSQNCQKMPKICETLAISVRKQFLSYQFKITFKLLEIVSAFQKSPQNNFAFLIIFRHKRFSETKWGQKMAKILPKFKNQFFF